MSNSSNLIAKDATVSFCCVEVGRYVVFPCIGKANNRKYNVHLAKEKETDKLYAIRICTLEDEKDDTDFFFLQKEIRILSQLKHSNILQLVDVFVAGSDILFVTPLMDYGSVKDLIHFRYHFGLPEQLIATVLYDVLLALEYLHEHDFIHRSVRCSHILLSSQGKVCLSGFRLVTSVLESDRRLRKLHEFTEDFQSSLMWFAPEVLEQNIAGYGIKSDIYSLGIAGCEMANGFVPFSNMSNIQMFWEKLRGVTPRLLDGKTLPAIETTDPMDASTDEQRNRWFSDKFHAFIELCLKFHPYDRSNLIAKDATVSFCCVEVGRYVVFPCIGKANNRKYNVHLAKEKETDKLYAIRICTLEDEKDDTDFFFLQKEIRILSQLKHSNILQLVDVFVAGSDILFVTPLMDYGSVKDLIHFRYHFGLPEQLIATVLYDVLLALEYLHEHDFIHRSVRCSHILLSSQGKVCLSGFRLVTSVLESDRRLRKLHEFTEDFQSSLMWFAPEVLEQNIAGYGIKSDIYSLGIAGCEMANGFVPFSNMSNIQMFWEKLRGVTPRLLDGKTLPASLVICSAIETTDPMDASTDEQRNRWFSDKFHAFIELCLKFHPYDRPTAKALLKHGFFRQYKKECRSVSSFLADVNPLSVSEDNIHGGFLAENTFPTSLEDSGSSKEFCDHDHDANTYWSFGD
ncbi:STE20-related kinase adapter protein alpha [Trichinella zimbabwensis]|uniref:STE20-related kinase adapter protein alpha n=1 Tax=Trichinella zimbabwensis TaxID=268475 RepID=A0A0V1GTV7_9BILA|nr:STE20-related kinase adapter protein alpha [Trichinella zimbabwensis]